ncbi:hypothetical protein Pfo_026486 [Paulownia fortunei]|nr:hypothetical protein Pfo_026486 [Paulownia fortunei]
MTMFFTCQKQSRSLGNKGRHEFTRLVETPEKSLEPLKKRKIHRLRETTENPGQMKEPSGQSGQSRELCSNQDQRKLEKSAETGNSDQQKTDPGDISFSGQNEASVDNASRPLDLSLPKFGPFYVNNNRLLLTAREEAWKRVLGQIAPTKEEKSSEEESEKIKQDYISAMRNVEKEAMETYAGSFVLTDSDFRWMMIKDGCFFLQLALLILGGSEPLGYPVDHVIFGRRQNRKKYTTWLNSMFFVGNQIPVVVLQELMKQSFFQKVLLEKGTWDRPSVLSQRVLYELLVLPSLDISSPERGFFQWNCCRGRSARREEDYTLLQNQPSDVLQGLQSMILGPRLEHEEYEPEDMDLEANWKESTSEEKRKINATSLRNAGIQIKHIQGVGTRGIYFQETCFSASLYLPRFTVEDDTELILENVKNYEITQPLDKNEREVCSYLRFIGDIIRTSEDVKLLVEKGIIQGSQQNRDKLPGILRRLDSKELTQHLYRVKLQISAYCRPAWQKHLKQILSGVAVLTVIQTVYAMLSMSSLFY